MKKNLIFLAALLVLTACDKHDPILPGVRSPIFKTNTMTVLDTPAPEISDNFASSGDETCEYRLDEKNTIWDGERKIFTGFATENSVSGNRQTYCYNGFVYAGLTTGELIKINPKNRQIKWIADIYSPSNMTGGASVLDIVAPVVFDKNDVYVGGLGKAFCKISDQTGKTKWCLDFGVERKFLIGDTVGFVLDTDKNLYAVRLTDGAVYWQNTAKKSVDIEYSDGKILVGRQKFDAKTGELMD